jgi:hypothetical protein
MQLNPPSDELAALVTGQASPILDYRFKDKSLLELLESEDSSFGLGANPMSLEAGFLDEYTGPFRTPGFLMKQGVVEGGDVYFWIPDVGSCDNSPVLYDESLPNKVVFFRNVAISDELLVPAANVIRFAAGILSRAPNDSNWTAIRIFEQNLTPITDILTVIDNYLSGFLGSVQTLIDSIIAAIQAIRARLNQLQALLETIRALLRSLSAFTISPMSALITVGDGTDGLLSNFVNSTNKPSDGPDSYGAGMVLVSGGPNRFFFELLGLT